MKVNADKIKQYCEEAGQSLTKVTGELKGLSSMLKNNLTPEQKKQFQEFANSPEAKQQAEQIKNIKESVANFMAGFPKQ